MALDFSQYDGPSEDWLELAKTLPTAQLFDTNTDLLALKEKFNSDRLKRSADMMVELKPHVHMTDYTIPTRDGAKLDARTYRPIKGQQGAKLPVFVYFHGGGFVFGTLSGDDATCSQIAIKTGVLVLNANYRHTPEHTFPTAWNDSQDAIAWLFKNIDEIGGDPNKVIIGGTSAGGQLTASLILEKNLGKSEVLKGLPDIMGQILMTPCLASPLTYDQGPGKHLKTSSYVSNENAPIMNKKIILYFIDLMKAKDIDIKDTKINVANASSEDVKGLPPTVISVAGLDPLRDEGLIYAKTLAEANVPTQTWLFKGVPHGHRRFGNALKASAHFDECFFEGIKWILEKPTATGKFEIKVP